jgi:spore coat polysaccharide biosynthesis protein SpsF
MEEVVKVVAILQARMGSSRLPGKVLAPVLGQPLLAHLIQRVRPARCLDQLVVATTRLPQDDPIETLAHDLETPCFRGAVEDCLDRYYQAARQFHAGVVVRLTGDCPLVDGAFVDWWITQYRSATPQIDYLSSSLSQTFPLGLAVEVFSFAALETAWREDTTSAGREHVTPFLYRHPERFRLGSPVSPRNHSSMRWTVDTDEDLMFIRQVYEHFGFSTFSWQEALAIVRQHPEWVAINQHVEQRVVP